MPPSTDEDENNIKRKRSSLININISAAKKKKRIKRFERINTILSTHSEDETGNIITTCAIIETPIDQVSPVNPDRRIMEHNFTIAETRDSEIETESTEKEICQKCTEKFTQTSVRKFANPISLYKILSCKKCLLACLLKRIIIKPVQTTRKSVPIDNQRSTSREYGFFKNKTVFERVCKNCFMSTLYISSGPIETAVKHVDDHGVFTKMEHRGRQAPANKTPEEQCLAHETFSNAYRKRIEFSIR
ncbi:unnamed protein product [Arctia plantaginis]|uniref:Uncharacterized protein n=1 Tax=Arctia plantaginis TaxID=874455 RepID=A0A8S0ZEH2_ARCPL|nr:unnamed protein product [Arctia plantaginis]CAB3252438.1 unnamed protein product [Arctia plantaginis]